jgi:microcystin-dependent protein
MAEPFIGEIRSFSFKNVPTGWAPCNGQILQVTQYQALYTVIGKQFGGDGVTTFALPNLQGCVPLCPNDSTPSGSVGGEESYVLTVNEIPQHTHQATAGSDATTSSPVNATWGKSTASAYANQSNTTMAENALATAGSSAAHSNMQPYTVVNFCIALQGIYPPKN